MSSFEVFSNNLPLITEQKLICKHVVRLIDGLKTKNAYILHEVCRIVCELDVFEFSRHAQWGICSLTGQLCNNRFEVGKYLIDVVYENEFQLLWCLFNHDKVLSTHDLVAEENKRILYQMLVRVARFLEVPCERAHS